ncbi:MAG TPA: AraC family transcriptional regulator [Dongiaceae bacterium]
MQDSSEQPQATSAGPQVLAAAASGIADVVGGLGGDVERVFRAAKIDKGVLENPINEISLGQYCRMFEHAAIETQYDNFGLRFGIDFKPRQLGPIGYMAINSPTLAAGLRNLVDYFPAHQQMSTLALRADRDIMTLEYQINDGRIGLRRQDAELSLGMFCNVFYHCLGRRWAPLELHFEHPRPWDAREHEALFDAPVFFTQPTNAILFRRRDMDTLMPDPDPYLFSLLEPMMSGRRRRSASGDLIGLVQQKIEAHLGHSDAVMKKVAQDLGMSSWTLQRRLRDLNVSFSDLVRGARRELAMRYVAEPHIALTEIAFLLGYSELSAFSRAFHQWVGMSPARFRREHMKRRAHTAG